MFLYQIQHVFFIASGGSEQKAINLSEPHKGIILLCHRESNSFAAAMEIAAYLRSIDKKVTVIDVFAKNAQQDFIHYSQLIEAINNISGQKAAVIGHPSDWLINSTIDAEILKKKIRYKTFKSAMARA